MALIPTPLFDKCLKLRLSKNPYRILWLIVFQCYRSETKQHEWCDATNEKIAIMTRMSLPAIKKALMQLEEKKLIDVKVENGKRLLGVLCLK